MKLFFETASQASLFLAIVPIGFCLAVFVDLAAHAGRLKHLWDVLAMLLCLGMVAFSIVLLKDSGLRMYHFLAVCTGALLYTLGVRGLLASLCSRLKRFRKKDAAGGRNSRS